MKGIFGERFRPRRYKKGMGPCQDCGWNKPLTVIHFWSSGMEYRVCSDCIRPYRTMILHPDPEWSRA